MKADREVQIATDAVELLTARFDVRRAELDAQGNEFVSPIDAQKNVLSFEEAKRRLAQLEQVRARLGMTTLAAPAAVTGPAALTPREREVALLIADGLTNTDLGRRLYISPKTAAVHVSSILRKLGVASRTEVGSVIGQP